MRSALVRLYQGDRQTWHRHSAISARN